MKRLGNGVGSVYRLSGKRSKPWAARKTIGFNEKGHPKYKYIGYYRTKADAMAALVEYNKSPYSLNKESVGYVYERFMASFMEHHKEKTVKNKASNWKHLEPLKDREIATLSRKDLQEYFDSLQVSELVKENCRSLLRQIYDYAVRYDIIQPERVAILDYIDMTSSIKIRGIERARFTNDEIQRIIEIDDNMAHILLFLIYTGLRAGEFCDLTEADIDDELVIHINNSKTKAGVRDVPLSDKALKLMPLPHICDYKKLYRKYSVWRIKHNIGHNLHDTRHTTISLLTEAKVDERIIKSIVGHRGSGVTQQVYTHISIDVKREVLNKI